MRLLLCLFGHELDLYLGAEREEEAEPEVWDSGTTASTPVGFEQHVDPRWEAGQEL